MERTIRCLALCVLSAIGVAGCGGSSETKGTATGRTPDGIQVNALGRQELPQIRRMVDRLITGVNARDTSICTGVYTPRYREELMGRKGDAALKACRSEVKRANIKVALDRIERVQIRRAGDDLAGTVQLVQRIGADGRLRVKFDVIRAGGAYRIDGAEGTQLSAPPDANGGGRRAD